MSERFTLLHGRRLPAWLDRRIVVVGPGAERPYDAEDWRDAIAVLEQGSIVVEHAGGEPLRLEEGAVFSLARTALIAIRNDGGEAAIIAIGTPRRVPS